MIQQLYSSLQPRNYNLKLQLDREKMKFSGSVTISAEVLTNTKALQLHSKGLEITSATIDGTKAQLGLDSGSDLLNLTSNETVNKGKHTIALEFNGLITDAMHGLYPCYFEVDGKKKFLLATQFESHHAREVFPCVDEPAAKATFDLELTTDDGETTLANTPVKSQKSVNNKQVTVFETTPKMSTYLLAFVCGEMVYKEAKTKDGVIVRSWASAAQDPSLLDYSLKEAVGCIEFYNDYFGTPYPLTKCDQVALPDFESGAMENWGLITYRESMFLSDPNNPSLSTNQVIAIVVAHELSHQWFGNLVTMKWWDDLWLNESFASMMEYIAVDHLHPEWQIWEDYVSQDAVIATNRDVYSNVQPVRVEVSDPEEIHTLFDPAIVYAKGGKLLKALHDTLGSKAWRAGLKEYFKLHAYSNTTRDDLWQALESQSSLKVGELMNSWLEKPGLPILNVDQQTNNVKISQNRLLLDGKTNDSLWEVPLLTPGLPPTLKEGVEEFKLDKKSWVQLNKTGVGHYVTNYVQTEHKKWLTEAISNTETESTWKITHLNELVMLAKHGDTDLSEALETIKHLPKEPRAAVWSQIAVVLGSSRMIVEYDEELEDRLRGFTYKLVKEQFETLGWEYELKEDSNTTHLRSTIVGLALASEEKNLIDKALELYRAVDSPEVLPAELRSMLMGVAVRFGSKDEFMDLIKRYKTSANADYRNDIAAALNSTKSVERAKKLTNLMLDTDTVRTQDTIRWYVQLLRNRYTRETAWQWLTNNWQWIVKNFASSKSFDDFTKYSASFFSTKEDLEKYRKFFEPYANDPSLKRSIAIGLAEIEARADWRQRDLGPVTTWLKQH